MNEQEKKVIDDVATRLLSTAGALNRDGFISREDMRIVLATMAGQLGALLSANGTDETSGTNGTTGTDGTPRKIWRFRDALKMPRGIEMQPFYQANGLPMFVGQYHRHGAPEGSKPKRVYCVKLCSSVLPGEISAAVYEDDVSLVRLTGASKWNLAYAALGALRGILHKRCTHTGSNKRAKRRGNLAQRRRDAERG